MQEEAPDLLSTMATTYHIDHSRKLCSIILTGKITGVDLTSVLEEVAADDTWKPGYDAIWDLTKVGEIIIAPEDTQDVRRISEAYAVRWGPGKTAILTSRDIVFWISKLFEVSIRIPGRQIKAFLSRNEATQWLSARDYRKISRPLA